jgi:hypothetical protein
MKIDAKILEQRIDEIPGVCLDGKKAIKNLFKDAFGITFLPSQPVEFKCGGVYRAKESKNYFYWLSVVYLEENNRTVNLWQLRNINDGCGGWYLSKPQDSASMQKHLDKDFILVANSLAEFYKGVK